LRNADAGPHADVDRNGHGCVRDACSRRDGHGIIDTRPDNDARTGRHTNSHAFAHGHQHGDADANRHTNSHPFANADQHGDADADTDDQRVCFWRLSARDAARWRGDGSVIFSW
jgi:hypothetical protein